MSSAMSKWSASSKAGRTGTSDRGPRRKRSGVGSGSGIQLMSFASVALPKRLHRRDRPSYSPIGGGPWGRAPSGAPAPGLVRRDETNADHRSAARAAERRKRRLRLSERRNESETVGLRDAPLALRAAQLAAIQLGVGRL